MIYTSENSVADNGYNVQSCVELIDPDAPRNRWRYSVLVNGNRMFYGHADTRAEAESNREKMHACYLRVHAAK